MAAPLPSRTLPRFDPVRHAPQLAAALAEIAALPRLDDGALDRVLRRHPKDGRGFFSRSDLIAGARHLARTGALRGDVEPLVRRLRLRPVRTLSGVTPVTVLTKPFPCPGRCVFCPSDVRMPKSYLSAEPGAQRAADHRFDPYLQTWSRLAAYREIGHPVDKVELIVLGGTWSAYPEPYQIWFVTRCLDALGDFGAGVDGRARVRAAPLPEPERRVDGRSGGPGYNALVAGRAVDTEASGWGALRRAQRRNEDAACRAVGLAVETRPDRVSEAEVRRLRRLGVTKVQIGIQSLSDGVLAANRRGHDVAATRRALRLLRGAGFKLHAHWMPNLMGATPASDAADFVRLFDDPDFRPDELKIYPCLLVESAELARYHAAGAWRPYGDDELLGVIGEALRRTPPWCRVTRVVRDFSAGDVAAGTHTANLREVAERRLRRAGHAPRDIRSRELRAAPVGTAALALEELRYATSIGEERFLQLVTPEGRLAAFLRLALPAEAPCLDELRGRAVVREVHVYGASLELGRRGGGAAQHRGLGRSLVERAAAIAGECGYEALAVISAVGTRAWYRTLGFRDGPLYQHRPLALH